VLTSFFVKSAIEKRDVPGLFENTEKREGKGEKTKNTREESRMCVCNYHPSFALLSSTQLFSALLNFAQLPSQPFHCKQLFIHQLLFKLVLS
jgi:hypothetical protein